jgi:sulfite reductase (ferredoxin)
MVPKDDIVPSLVPVFERFQRERINGESFGDFCHRLGKDALAPAAAEEEPAESV